MPLESGHQREARYNRIAESYRQRSTLADTLAHLRARWHQLLDAIHDHHANLDDLTTVDYTPVPVDVPPQLLNVSAQLGGLLLRVQAMARTYPPAADAATEMHHDLDPLRAQWAKRSGFVAPRTLTPPRPIHLAIERLRSANLLPIDLEHLSDSDDQAGRDQRLLAFWLRTLDDD